MHAWPAPDVPALETAGPPVQLHDTSRGEVVPTDPGPDGARLYVCGITPYDATHMGHAATYVAFDLLNRAWRNAGHRVTFVENVTDVDDPLLERATKVGTGWEELALRETQLFREDMIALNVLPPAHFVGAVESIPWVLELIAELDAAGATYVLDGDVYYAVGSDTAFGQVSGWSRETMLEIFPERGGDPDREGKRDPLDPLLWRAERPGEPSWPSPYGPGRPGWHVECSAIAQRTLGGGFDVQAGGSDLVFPHHEMSAGHAQVATDSRPFARIYAHAGMVGYDGEKMSKSRGNLVFVSALRRSDVDPMAIRLVLLEHHYRSDWEWRDALVFDAVETLATWREVLHADRAVDAEPLIRDVLDALADDLDAPRAVLAVEEWMQAARQAPADPVAAKKVRDLLDAALGLAL